MLRIAGSVPGDVPSYHAKGWVTALTAEQRAVMHRNALTEPARLHRCPWRGRFDFLLPSGGRSPPTAYVDIVHTWAAAFDADLTVNRDIVMAALEFVRRPRPARERTAIVWGDARVGNMIFAEDLSVVALLDWEAAIVGPAELDLGWWLMFEEYICESASHVRLPGVSGRAAIVESCEALLGRSVEYLDYFEVLAALVLSIVNSRLPRS